ncbi:MAG: helix-turn-helix domain-containing protein [Chloroflexi bacterium]|nr:helix-turn-helix domain-containing protein [Chloroflexota bacterium]
MRSPLRAGGIAPAQLHARRRGLGLTQTELGAGFGITANTVARWERGESPIGNPELVGLAIEQLASRFAAGAGRRSRVLPRPEECRSARGTTPVDICKTPLLRPDGLRPISSPVPLGVSIVDAGAS